LTEADNRVALIGVIVENPDSVEDLNMVLHDFREWIIGRMGIPYKLKDISVISVAMDAPADVINALSGKLGRLDGVSAKTIYSKNNI
jgi:putative iron-only hydrogenase system regulator